MIAIIQTGGKQYQVTVGTKLKVEKLEATAGAAVTFPALFVGDEKAVQVAMPDLKATVEATVLAHGKHDEVKGIRHKAKKREMTRYGHRQPYTEVEITKINA
ncbi:MAG: 50S ribosomal protein L21 [Candidatus Moraniibacteriota bacterium]|nr:MAG: 50S ribosomal protein L21 [Candidatus Moranbacteria bacterium]